MGETLKKKWWSAEGFKEKRSRGRGNVPTWVWSSIGIGRCPKERTGWEGDWVDDASIGEVNVPIHDGAYNIMGTSEGDWLVPWVVGLHEGLDGTRQSDQGDCKIFFERRLAGGRRLYFQRNIHSIRHSVGQQIWKRGSSSLKCKHLRNLLWRSLLTFLAFSHSTLNALKSLCFRNNVFLLD